MAASLQLNNKRKKLINFIYKFNLRCYNQDAIIQKERDEFQGYFPDAIMEILQLIYFCSAAETENFSKTARIFGVPTTGISQSVKRLENELGVSLFDRVSKSIKLNEQGRKFYLNIKSSLAIIDDAKRKLREEEIEGTIKLLVITNRTLINKTIGMFHQKYKNVFFEIHHTPQLHVDKYDLIITDNFGFSESYERVGLVTDKIVVAMEKNHPLASKENILIEDLKDEKFIVYNEESGLFSIMKDLCRKGSFVPKLAARVDDPYSLAQCVEMGVGIAMIPYFAYKELFSENVCMREFTEKKRKTVVAYNKGKYMSKATKVFYEMLMSQKIK